MTLPASELYVDCILPRPLPESFTYKVSPTLRGWDGSSSLLFRRVMVTVRGKSIWALVVGESFQEPDFQCKDVESIIDAAPVVGKEYWHKLLQLADFYLCTPGEMMQTALPSGRRLRNQAAGQKSRGERLESSSFALNEDQSASFAQLASEYQEARKKRENRIALLHGVTGSGKTEVYVRLAQEVIARGQSVLVLVPEISITLQLRDRFLQAFGSSIIEYHSRMKNSERYEQWHLAFSGRGRIAIGTRSAVFLPMMDLGLIILDEEHDSSYKEHSTPRYHARQVAFFLLQEKGGLLLLGSATPSVESYFLAEQKKIGYLRMPRRATPHSLPDVNLIDMSRQNLPSGKLISATLKQAMTEVLAKNQQVLLLQNRRGYAPLLQCRSCNYVYSCPNCDIPLSFHRKGGGATLPGSLPSGKLQCHYCGYERTVEPICAVCHSPKLALLGVAIQKIEEEIRDAFPEKRIVRLDFDSAREGEMFSILERFRLGQEDILLGTQMVAKGFNFPGVTLVGVVQADIGLGLPDFRASERTFSLLTQVAGRSGRGEEKGRVLIQTYQPGSPVMQSAIHQNYEQFFINEMSQRHKLMYPPYSRIIRIVFRSPQEDAAIADSSQFAQVLRQLYSEDRSDTKEYMILGPSAAPFARMNTYWRYHILVKERSLYRGRQLLQRALDKMPVKKQVYREIDIDPLDIL